MDIEEKELLEETHAMAVQNNKLLKSMKRNARFGFVFKLLLWAVAIGVPLWLYVNFLAPVVDQLGATMEQVRATGSQLQETGAKIRDVTDATAPVADIASQGVSALQKLLDALPF